MEPRPRRDARSRTPSCLLCRNRFPLAHPAIGWVGAAKKFRPFSSRRCKPERLSPRIARMRRIAPTSPRSRRRRIASACICAALALGLGGCGAVRTIAGINTVHLEQARVDSMQIDLASGAATVCPRERVQMHVVVGAQLPSQPAPLLYETWRGSNGTRRNGMLDFRNFAFNSEQGRFDELGWFAPNPDVLATVDSGFAIGANLIHPSAQFARTAHYPPSYDCIAAVGAPAAAARRARRRLRRQRARRPRRRPRRSRRLWTQRRRRRARRRRLRRPAPARVRDLHRHWPLPETARGAGGRRPAGPGAGAGHARLHRDR
ncbi:hypothetical protein FE772_20340 [Lysobacter enzymogenes]|nr:hypothetical protein FE772_20340 [Lysobacter enzymogenes]